MNKAIILAAGKGSRLGFDRPKCTIEVGGKSIIHRQLQAMRAEQIEHFVLVTGFARSQLVRHLADQPGNISYVVNEQFDTTNTIFSLYLARHHMRGGFFCVNADVVFDRRLITRLSDAGAETAMAVRVGALNDEDVKVIVDGGRITQLGKQLPPSRCLGEFLGVAQIGSSTAEALVESLEHLVERRGIVSDYFERALDEICHACPLTPVDISDLPCSEIDFPADLQFARDKLSPLLSDER